MVDFARELLAQIGPTRLSLIAALLAALGFGIAAVIQRQPKDRVELRLKSVLEARERGHAAYASILDDDEGDADEDAATTETARGWRQRLGDAIVAAIAPLPLIGDKEQQRVRALLARAGVRSANGVPLFLAAKLGGAAGVGLLALFTAAFHPAVAGTLPLQGLIVIAGAAVGALAPEIVLRSRAQERQQKLNRALPDALDLLVICAEAGLSLDVAVARVGHEMTMNAPELAQEFEIASAELRLLPDRQDALENLAERTGLPAMRSLVATLAQAQKYGTSLAQSMRVISAEIRNARMLSVEEKAARIPAMISVPLIVFILPAIFLVVAGPAAIEVVGMMQS